MTFKYLFMHCGPLEERILSKILLPAPQESIFVPRAGSITSVEKACSTFRTEPNQLLGRGHEILNNSELKFHVTPMWLTE